MGKSQELYRKAKKIIPGGTQLLSKRPEMFLPDYWPSYYSKAKGCEVWDLDNNHFIDMSYMGVGSCTIGYADDDIDSAVINAIKHGNMSTLNVPEEVELAELLCELHPWADMVRYARSGGEACSIAIRIARAYSKRDVVLFSGYHGWSDWYLSSNIEDESNLNEVHLAGLEPNGVPRSLAGTSYPFFHNDTESFISLIEKLKDKVGAVIIEPIRDKDPTDKFLTTIRKYTKKYGVPFIIDEVSAGFRMNPGGSHMNYNVIPDLVVFAKGMSNGYPMAAVLGNKEVMQASQTSFISSTYWTDKIGPVAALATIRKGLKENIYDHMINSGKRVKEAWMALAKNHKIDIQVGGMNPIVYFTFENESHLILKTIYTQLMLERGILATNTYYASFAHKDEHINKYISAVDDVFSIIYKAKQSGNPEKFLKGSICHSGFQRLT